MSEPAASPVKQGIRKLLRIPTPVIFLICVVIATIVLWWQGALGELWEVLREANLLILDEPTNDLDLLTLQVLESALADFGGCVLVVTHDRYFLDKVATGLLVFEGNGVVHRHEGGYDLYRRLREEREAAAAAPAPPARGVKGDGGRGASGRSEQAQRRLTYKEQRELQQIEGSIAEAEAELARLQEVLSDPALYSDTPEKVAEATAAFRDAGAQVEALYARWAELEEIASG